jgi:hypothetical protein
MDLKTVLAHILTPIVLILLVVIYFNPQLKGKVMEQNDLVQHKGMAQEMTKYKESEGRTMLWTNAMFGGMPTYQINYSAAGNKVNYVHKALHLFAKRPIGDFLCLMLSMYIVLVIFGVNPLVSAIGAISFAFTTNNIVLMEAGHATKVGSLSYIAPIVAGMLLLFKRKWILGGVVFTLGMTLNLGANHIQMTYYLALCLVIFWLVMTIMHIKNGMESGVMDGIKDVLKINAILLVGAGLAIMATSSNYLTTYEYSKDTMRGKPILEKTNEDPISGIGSSSETDGLHWEYAMQWSNGTRDLFASIIPGAVGGSSAEVISPDGELRKMGLKKGSRAPIYWGELSSTSGPAYFGAILCFLFILGLRILKGPTKWLILSSVVLTMILSMGRNFESINHFLFDYLPLFNKFRTPNSVLGVTAFFVAFMGVLTMHKLYKGDFAKDTLFKDLKVAAGVAGGFCLLMLIMGSSFFDFSHVNDQGLAQNYGWDLNALEEDRMSLFKADSLRSLVFILLAAGGVWLLMKEKIKPVFFVLAVGALILFDLWGVNKRYLNEDSFVRKSKYENLFQPRPVDAEILKDQSLSYRVLDMSVNTFNNATSSYYHKTIGGYHPAKLQRYQDLIDHHINLSNIQVFNMLNTKYIISREQKIQQNPEALGNAWFIDSIIKVETPNHEIDALKNFRADRHAVVLDSEFDNYVGDFKPQKNGSILLTSYVPDRLKYESNSSSEQFAVFSEIWYGPDKGWDVYVDGEKKDHIRVNYALRGMKVPAGKHEIEFRFEPQTYKTGQTLSGISSIVILLIMIGSIAFAIYRAVINSSNKAK